MCSELKLTIKAAKKAGDVILKYYKSKYEIREKSYHNPVTSADKEADETIKNFLMNNFPEYGWLSEETVDSNERLSKEKVWVVDPLDGTKEFIEGIPNFVVSIGLVKDGFPILGIIYNPVTKELFSASKGKGAFLNDKRISCRSKESTEEMIILNSRSETRRGLWDPYQDKFKVLEPIGSVAYKLGLTAAAKADVFASLRPKNEWDICAGNCIINESGGKLIDLNGNQRKYNLEETLIKPGLIAGDVKAVDKTYLTLKG
jgi:myo-inositol-1(or 4)-monophosphatase